jgi:exopolysaccharide production protein ExoZ
MTQIARPLTHSGTPRTQLLSIQYLRGLAALSVLATHALQWPLAEINMGLLKTGRLGVDVFFVVSGFIITTIAGDGRFDPREFLIRRAFRIVLACRAAMSGFSPQRPKNEHRGMSQTCQWAKVHNAGTSMKP